jgi:hypothetical protein
MRGVLDLLPEGLSHRVRTTFELIAIAETELACEGNPPDAWRLLLPPEPMRDMHPNVYRAHVRELLRRLDRGEDTRPGTRPECLCALVEASLAAPLRGGYAAAFEVLFREVFPDRAVPGTAAREAYPGEVAEILTALRRRTGQPARTR